MVKNYLLALATITLITGCTNEKSNPGLDEIFTSDMLGSTVGYLEKFTGVPKVINDDVNEYRIGPCSILAYKANGHINSLQLLEVSKQCTFDLGKMMGPDGTYVHQLTYGKVAHIFGKGHFTANCLGICGNAYDPSIYMTISGGYIVNYKDIQLETLLSDDEALKASIDWENHMVEQEGNDYVSSLEFNKTDKYDDVAFEYFKNVPITSIRIGYHISKNNP